jgi:ribosomal protein L18E
LKNSISNLISLGTGGLPKYDLVGPTVDNDIRRAINRYGADAVKDAIKRLTNPRRGRPKINDWKELASVIEADAKEWIAGGDPIATRSNYAVAKQFADANPGQSAISTHQRIERKLKKKPFDRHWYLLIAAENLTRENYSWKQHIRSLEGLAKTDSHPVWQGFLDTAKSEVADYEAKQGELPADALTMKEVQDIARNGMIKLSQLASGASSGLLPRYIGNTKS